MTGRGAFWSYVRQDDADEGGRVSRLAHLLSAKLRLLTGEEFPVFLDRESIGWGEDWEEKIDEALLSTTFFVPIVTPSYFRSDSCRKELVRFSSTATALGLEELILPIYYVSVPELNTPPLSGDDLVELIRRYQWIDWRDTALEDAESAVHRKGVDALAKQLLQRAMSADAKPTPTIATYSAERSHEDTGEGSGLTEDDEEPGTLEILAEGEEALPRLNALLEAYTPVLQRVSETAEQAAEQLRQSDKRGKGFAGRLRVGRWFANELAGPAEELERLAAGFLEELLKIDPMVVAIVQLVDANRENEDWDQIESFLASIDQMADAAERGLGSFESLAVVVHENVNWSKDLRKPLQRIERALRQSADARAVFRRWKALASDLRKRRGGDAP